MTVIYIYTQAIAEPERTPRPVTWGESGNGKKVMSLYYTVLIVFDVRAVYASLQKRKNFNVLNPI